MSKETLETLNTQTLIGHTDHRGTAWHYRAEYQGGQSNHYPGAIPPEDVHRRLFHWRAESRPIGVEVPATLSAMTHLDAEGRPVRWMPLPLHQAITRSDNNHVMGIFSAGYVRHQYDEWLLTNVSNLLDDTLSISSAGLLRDGAVAWVEVSVPDTISTPEGIEFRPNLLATTSFDGSIATTYKRTITATVCDNTRALALSESGQQIKIKHSRNSSLRIVDARDALSMVHDLGEAFEAEVAALCQLRVDDRAWAQFLDHLVPQNDEHGGVLTGRAATLSEKKRASLESLYRHDHRVAPWRGTAFGVLQAVNTYEHHVAAVRGASRPERNQLRTVTGDFAKVDATTWKVLERLVAA